MTEKNNEKEYADKQNTCNRSYYRILDTASAKDGGGYKDLAVRCCGESVIRKDFSRNYHPNNDYELIYILGGSIKITINGKEYEMNKGDFICRSPYSLLSISTVEPMNEWVRYYWIHFDSQDAAEPLLESVGIELNRPYTASGSDGLMEEYENLFSEFRLRGRCFPLAASVSVTRIILMLSRMRGKPDDGTLDRSLKYIHARFRHDIKVGELAALEYLGETRYRELFREYTSLSPHEYISALRIEKAKDLLGQVDMTIGDVAKAVGYGDSHYFQRVFKKREGITPGEYRESLVEHGKSKV
jgi:AraC-like DNA-binding protein